MNRIASHEILTDDLTLPDDCRFRIWSRAQLEVGDRHVMLEGSHAGLMLELLRNRGRRVSAEALRCSMLGSSQDDGTASVEVEVGMEIRRVRYMLAANGILLSVDDSEPQEGFMLSALCQIICDPPSGARRRKSRTRRTHKAISDRTTERPTFIPGHSPDPADVPYAVPERLERRILRGGEK